MRPSANVDVDTTSMNRRGAERSTSLLHLFFGERDISIHKSVKFFEWESAYRRM